MYFAKFTRKFILLWLRKWGVTKAVVLGNGNNLDEITLFASQRI